MKEELFAYALLLETGLIPVEIYEKRIYELFLKNQENEMLLELVGETSDINKTVRIINENTDCNLINESKFGEVLFRLMEISYNNMDIEKYGPLTYKLWEKLPRNFRDKEPFNVLTWADDPLACGNIGHTKRNYENLFEYYK